MPKIQKATSLTFPSSFPATKTDPNRRGGGDKDKRIGGTKIEKEKKNNLHVGEENGGVEKGSGAEAGRDSEARGARDRELGRGHETVAGAAIRSGGDIGV